MYNDVPVGIFLLKDELVAHENKGLYAVRTMIRPQHVDKGKLNKTLVYIKSKCGHSILLDIVIWWTYCFFDIHVLF